MVGADEGLVTRQPRPPAVSLALRVTSRLDEHGSGVRRMHSPSAVAFEIGLGERAFIADALNYRVHVIDSSTCVFLSTTGRWGLGQGEFDGAVTSLLVAGSELLVGDRSRVQAFSLSGSWLRTIGHGEGSDAGQLSDCFGLAEHEGEVFVSEYGNDRISVFEMCSGGLPISGPSFKRKFSLVGSSMGQLSGPCGLALEPVAKELFVADHHNHRVVVFSLSGEPIATFGTRGVAPGQLISPFGVALAGESLLAISETEGRRVQLLSRRGEPHALLALPGKLWGLSLRNDGAIFVCDGQNHCVHIVEGAPPPPVRSSACKEAIDVPGE